MGGELRRPRGFLPPLCPHRADRSRRGVHASRSVAPKAVHAAKRARSCASVCTTSPSCRNGGNTPQPAVDAVPVHVPSRARFSGTFPRPAPQAHPQACPQDGVREKSNKRRYLHLFPIIVKPPGKHQACTRISRAFRAGGPKSTGLWTGTCAGPPDPGP
jgi:hypothetical protein